MKGIFGENVLAGNVAEVEKGIQSLGEIGGDEAFKCVYKHLVKLSICSHSSYIFKYLHQRLRVIAGPLLEVPSLLVPLQTGKKGCECNAVRGF